MIRIFVLILVLANAAFYLWMGHGLSPASPEAQLIDQQIKPESIRLLPAEPPEGAGAQSGAAVLTATCVEWGAFDTTDIERAQKVLDRLGVGAQASERLVEQTGGWWVYLPPQSSLQAANQKIAELRGLGLSTQDYSVVQDDPKRRFAISLGAFRSEEAARKQLAQLREHGVRTAQLDRRGPAVRKLFLQVREVPAGAREKLAGVQEEFPGAGLHACPSGNRDGSG